MVNRKAGPSITPSGPLGVLLEGGRLSCKSVSRKYEPVQEVLSIAARRLIRTAALVAENAARGHFPCDKPFAEAQLDYYKRKAGRPVGSKRAKRRKAGA